MGVLGPYNQYWQWKVENQSFHKTIKSTTFFRYQVKSPQALRITERCSDQSDASLHLEKLKRKLIERNYPVGVVDKQFDRAKNQHRKQLIYKNRQKKGDDKVRCIFTFNQGNPPLHLWLRQAKKCLVKNKKAKALGDKMQITFRQPKNWKKIATGLPRVGERVCESKPNFEWRQILWEHQNRQEVHHQRKYFMWFNIHCIFGDLQKV